MAGPLLPIALGLGAAAQTYGQSRAAGRAADLSEEELAFIKKQYGEREPLRAMGLSRLQSQMPERPNLSAGFSDQSNPFSRERPAIGFGKSYSNQPPDLAQARESYRNDVQGGMSSAEISELQSTLSKLPTSSRFGDLRAQAVEKLSPEVRQALGL